MISATGDGRQSKKLLEGENLASFIYVTNDFLSSRKEPELRIFFLLLSFFPFLKFWLLTKELNRQQVFLVEKGFAA